MFRGGGRRRRVPVFGRRRGGPQRGRGRFRVLPLVLFGVFFLDYWATNREEVPLTGRTQLVDLSREQEMALGLQSYEKILSESRVVPQGEVVEVVREIGRRLAAVAEDPGFHSADRRGRLEWEFNVIASDQANAFALPGGKVAVYTGLMPVAENADGLAVVMGHEIAHAIARHGAERMAHQKLVQYGSFAAQMAVGDMDLGTQQAVMAAFGVGARYGVMLPFSRDHESEADYMGLVYLARACFDPTEAPRLWQRMGRASAGRAPSEFMSTHPSHETRIRQFEEWMAEAQRIRAESC